MKIKSTLPTIRAAATVAAGLTTLGFGAMGTAFAAAPTTANPTFNPARVSPNKLNAAQAQATILSDNDPFWEKAERTFPARVAMPIVPKSRLGLMGHGDRARKEIALTFDDGPHPGYTPQLLAVLKRYNVPATFFLVGEMAERSPELVRDELAQGDSIGNHTYHHVSLVKITPDEAAAEIRACDLVLQSITGKTAHLFRPPGGVYDSAVAREAAAQGYTTVLWTDDPGDYASPGIETIEKRTVKTAHNGGILLLHDGIQQTVDALPTIIQTLRAEGYKFVTVDQMLAEKSATPTGVTPLKGIAGLVSVAPRR